MSKQQKLIDRLKSKPRDLTFKEAESLLLSLGLKRSNKGKTSGSRTVYRLGNVKVELHKPHPRKELQPYQVLQLLQALEGEDLI